MFAISLLSLFGYHIYLISQNRTTLEAFRPPIFQHGGSNRKGFFLGNLNNFREVLGDQPALWFVPVFSSLGEGLTFPRQCQINEEDGFSDGYESEDTNRYVFKFYFELIISVSSIENFFRQTVRFQNILGVITEDFKMEPYVLIL